MMKVNLPVLVSFMFGLLACNERTTSSNKLVLVDSGFIFVNAPFQSCHASTVVALPGNRIMAAWFGGKEEGDSGVTIWSAIRENEKWSQPVEIANGTQADKRQFACWNPVFFKTQDSLILFYRVGPSPATWWSEMKTSADEGITWSISRRLPDSILGPIKNKPVQLSNGDMLSPSSLETVTGNKWTIHLERCDAKAAQWQTIPVDCDTFSAIQPTLLHFGKDSLQLLCRTRNNVIAQSLSADGGNSWTRLAPTDLPNPNSGIDAVTLSNGTQLLVYNPTQKGSNGRAILKVALSPDGKRWNDSYTLEENSTGEFSYPAVIQTDDGTIHISYTFNREKIKYVQLKL